jgi:hypothetical protein
VPVGSAGGLGSLGSPGGVKPPASTPDAKKVTRTDFVILFIWKENTPSDALRPTEVIKVEPTASGGMSGAGGAGKQP